jgi:hypothetical protein
MFFALDQLLQENPGNDRMGCISFSMKFMCKNFSTKTVLSESECGWGNNRLINEVQGTCTYIGKGL